METTKEILTAVTVAARYETLHTMAQFADTALSTLRFNLLTGIITEADEDILKQAVTVLKRIRSNTSPHDTLSYLKSLNQLT